MTIYDGASDASPLIGKYCGRPGLVSGPPPSLISTNNEIFIYFKTDSGWSEKGFKLEYKSRGELVITTNTIKGK